MKFSSSLISAALCLLTLLLASCGSKIESHHSDITTTDADDSPNREIVFINDDPSNHELNSQLKPKILVDSAVKEKDRARLNYDFSNLQKMRIEAADNGSFSRIFGNTSQHGIISYLNTRINYIVPGLTDRDLERRLITGDVASLFKPISMATNLGTLLWFKVLAVSNGLGTDSYAFKVNGKPVNIDSSRMGLIMLGEGYSLNSTSTADRISTLVHEARHSDCTGGLTKMDYDLIKEGELPESKACGHTHIKCPPGHPLSGEYACDRHQWGAYAIEWMFDFGMTKYCKNCTPEAKEIFRISSYDSKSRLLYDTDRMVRNTPPDMSSTNY